MCQKSRTALRNPQTLSTSRHDGLASKHSERCICPTFPRPPPPLHNLPVRLCRPSTRGHSHTYAHGGRASSAFRACRLVSPQMHLVYSTPRRGVKAFRSSMADSFAFDGAAKELSRVSAWIRTNGQTARCT
ncbi:hypothetical protein MN608_01826 [Microdochium nivale]|nr:hypothetical protein MN608_01826 [Microdochium nivale]